MNENLLNPEDDKKPQEPPPIEAKEESQKPPIDEEKEKGLFKENLVELVETEFDFSQQVGKMAKLLSEKLNHKPPLKLSNADRALLEEARKHYQTLAESPYPWFGSDYTPDKLKNMSYEEQQQLCLDLTNNVKNNTDRAEAINKRIEIMQWITMHYADITNLVNAKDKRGKFLLDLQLSNNYTSIPDRNKQVILNQYDLSLISVKDELPKENELHPPALIKMHHSTDEVSFHIYGCSDGKLKFTALDKTPQLNELDFSSQQKIPVSSEINSEIYQEIAAKKGHNTSMKDVSEQYVSGQYLIIPIQRIPRLILFTGNLINYTPSTDKEQTQELTNLLTKWKTSTDYSNNLVKLLESKNEVFVNLLKKVPPTKLPYVIPYIGKESNERDALNKQLEIVKEGITTYEGKRKSAKTSEEKKEIDQVLKTKKEAAGILEKEIKALDSVLENKAKALNAISTEELELFSAVDPKSTPAFLKNEDLEKLTAYIHHHQKEIISLFDEQKYQDINNLIKTRSAIPDKTFALFIDSNELKNMLASSNSDDLTKLTIDIRLHQKEITQLFGKTAYENTYNALQAKQKENNPDIAKAFSVISTEELALCSTKNPQYFLENLAIKNLIDSTYKADTRPQALINLTADVYVHQKELNHVFGPVTLKKILEALKKNNDPKITKAFRKLLPNNEDLIHLFRGKERLEATFNALKNPEELGKLHLAVRNHRQELIFLFGKDAYQQINTAFAQEYPRKCFEENEKALATLNDKKTLTPSEEQEQQTLVSKQVSLLSVVKQKAYTSLSHQEMDKLSNQEIELFTHPDPQSFLKKLKIEDLVKLTTDVRSHRHEITAIFSEQAYKDMGKEFVNQYKNYKEILISQDKGHYERWNSGYTHQQKADAVSKLLEAVDGKATLKEDTIKILEQGRLGSITKPLIEAAGGKEKLQAKESTSHHRSSFHK